MVLLQKSTPAYKGAKCDANGFCLAHHDVRLCRLTSNGQYKIVRKTCYKCGSAALMTDPNVQKRNVHGYRKKAVPHREVPSGLVSAGGGGDGNLHRHTKRIDHCSQPIPKGHDDRRRARTLSPRRSSIQRSPKKPLSKSHIIQKMSNETIKGLMKIKPPFSNSTKESQSNKVGKQESRTSEGIGHCHIHPEVQLAIRRTKRGNGKWEIAKDVCPHCSPSTTTTSGNVLNNDSNHTTHTQTVTPPSSPYPLSPKRTKEAFSCTDDYFSPVLVVYKEDNHHSPTSVSDKTAKHNNWSVLPNSTARIARADKEKKKKRVEHSKLQRQKAYEAWESLPVY